MKRARNRVAVVGGKLIPIPTPKTDLVPALILEYQLAEA